MARRILSPVLAVLLAALGVYFLVEAIPRLAGGHRPVGTDYHVVSTELMRRAWNDSYVLGAGAALAVAGAALAALAMARAPVPLTAGEGPLRVQFRRRDLCRMAAAAAAGVDGVATAKAAGRRDVTVTVRAAADAPADLGARVSDRVARRLGPLRLDRPPRVRVRLRRPRHQEASQQ